MLKTLYISGMVTRVSIWHCAPPMCMHKGEGGGGVETYYTLMICVSYSQVGENEPFVSELLTGLPTTIADLEPHQIHTFYESVCILYVLTKYVTEDLC